MQTTLLGLAIAFILALLAALVGPYFIDWNQFRPQFEAEATRVIGAQVRVGGKLDARLLPTPSLQLRSVVVGGANDLGKVRADKLDVEFSLGSLMRGEWRATELTINGMSLDLGLDPKGRIDWPASTGTFNLGSLAIDRLNLTGRIALHDAASRSTLELNDIAFSGDVRSLRRRDPRRRQLHAVRHALSVSRFVRPGPRRQRHPPSPQHRSRPARVRGRSRRRPEFRRARAALRRRGDACDAGRPEGQAATNRRGGSRPRSRPTTSAARLEQIELSYGAEERALKLAGTGDIRFGASPLLRASLSARQLDADRFVAKDNADRAASGRGRRCAR